jgi:CRP/FNR family cyclic AMP-dependent transcriptional regulator
MERVLLLHDVPLFTALSPDDLKQIADIAREQWYDNGSLICREGEPGREMHVLAHGQVRVTRQTPEGEKYLATRYAGDFLGEMSIVLATPRTSSVYAAGEVRTLVISAEALQTILHDRPDVALTMMRGIMQRFREIEDHLMQSPWRWRCCAACYAAGRKKSTTTKSATSCETWTLPFRSLIGTSYTITLSYNRSDDDLPPTTHCKITLS